MADLAKSLQADTHATDRTDPSDLVGAEFQSPDQLLVTVAGGRRIAKLAEAVGGAAALGHVGRTRRLVKSAGLIQQHPGGTLSQKFRDPADLDAFYRLANRKEVNHQVVLEPQRRRSRELMRQADGPVLTIHDTTELDYTGLTSLIGLGQIGKGTRRGYLCHNMLAVRADDGSAWPARSSRAATTSPKARAGRAAATATASRAAGPPGSTHWRGAWTRWDARPSRSGPGKAAPPGEPG